MRACKNITTFLLLKIFTGLLLLELDSEFYLLQVINVQLGCSSKSACRLTSSHCHSGC